MASRPSHSPLRVRRVAALALVLGLALGAGCRGSSPAGAGAARSVATRASYALQIGDYALAARLYEEALEVSPESLPLHYGRGVAASHLGRRDEAIRELSWVVDRVARGAGRTEESEAARHWLIRVGVLCEPEHTVPAYTAEDLVLPGSGSVEGQALAAADGFGTITRRRLQLFLVGRPTGATAEEFYETRTDVEGHFRFRGVAPGSYKLSDRVAGRPLWRLRVDVRSDERADLDLVPGNALPARDDFPDED